MIPSSAYYTYYTEIQSCRTIWWSYRTLRIRQPDERERA